MDKDLFKKKIYKNSTSQSVLIFACPFGTKIGVYTRLIKNLVKDGYNVVAYDFNNDVFLKGEPSYLVKLVNSATSDMAAVVNNLSSQGANNFGFFGTSLGAFVLYYASSKIPKLKWGVFSAGGNIAEGVWKLKSTKRAFIKKGYELDDLRKAWNNILYPEFLPREDNAHFLILGSSKDYVAPLYKLGEFAEYIKQKSGANVEIIKLNAYGHNHSGFIGLIRCRQLIKQLDV